MRVFIPIAVLAIVITGCQSVGSNPVEETGAVQTQAQELVNALVLTDAARTQEAVAKSTATPKPTVLLTEAPTPQSAEDLRNELISILLDCLENCEEMEDVETATVIRFTDSGLDIEVRTVWASQDRQPIFRTELFHFFLCPSQTGSRTLSGTFLILINHLFTWSVIQLTAIIDASQLQA